MTAKKYRRFDTAKSDKKPVLMLEDAGGLTICKIDWHKAKDLCQFCKSIYECNFAKREASLDAASNECVGFSPIHPEIGGARFSVPFMAHTERKKGILYSEHYRNTEAA